MKTAKTHESFIVLRISPCGDARVKSRTMMRLLLRVARFAYGRSARVAALATMDNRIASIFNSKVPSS